MRSVRDSCKPSDLWSCTANSSLVGMELTVPGCASDVTIVGSKSTTGRILAIRLHIPFVVGDRSRDPALTKVLSIQAQYLISELREPNPETNPVESVAEAPSEANETSDAETNPVESAAEAPSEANETSDAETNPVKKDENE